MGHPTIATELNFILNAVTDLRFLTRPPHNPDKLKPTNFLETSVRLKSLFLFTLIGITSSLHAQTDPLHAWLPATDPAGLQTWVDARLAAERTAVAQVVSVTGTHTIDNTLRPFDEAQAQLAIAGNEAYLLYAVGNSAPLRDKGQALSQAVSTAATELSLNQAAYKALASIDAKQADPATRHYLDRTLLEYRLGGVDKDDATRQKIRALQDRITSLSLTFGRNVQDGLKKITATKAELDGLPADYIARHTPAADGTYTLTTDSPDYTPVIKFARSADLRRRMYLAYSTRAYPVNKQVLLDLLAARQDLAGLLGFPNYATLATADQMMGSPTRLQAFLDGVDQASRASGDKEWALLMAFAQKEQPGLTTISAADTNYWSEQYRRSAYNFDSQSVRPYFPYDEVQAGILKTAARLFHLEFKAAPEARTWDPSVTTFDVYDAAGTDHKKLGRIYLDMHPRDGKDKWFSSAPVVPGIRGKQLPEGVLICNFSGGIPGDPGLMEYSDVVTFFHEFGHLMHHILGSQNEWSQQGGFNVEGDFVEAPSQMLEEFFRDPVILESFAKHYKTGEPIPASVIDQMNRAGAYGRAGAWQFQLMAAAYSLQLHDRPTSQVDLDGLLRQDWEHYQHSSWVDGSEFYASFTHLTGYASNYYTYVLDKVIAVDFFSQFDRKNLLDGPAAMRYRRTVLERGATVPAQRLVDDFLKRPENMDAFKAWLNVEFTQ
jgi:thimet oligopeptidase